MRVTSLTHYDSANCSLRNILVGIVGKGIKQKVRGTRFGSRVVVSSNHCAGSVTSTARHAINQRRLIRKVSVGFGVRNWSSKGGGKLDLGSRRCRQGMVLDVDHQYGNRRFSTRTSANARNDSMQPGSLFQRHRNSTAFWVLGVLNNSGEAFWIKIELLIYNSPRLDMWSQGVGDYVVSLVSTSVACAPQQAILSSASIKICQF